MRTLAGLLEACEGMQLRPFNDSAAKEFLAAWPVGTVLETLMNASDDALGDDDVSLEAVPPTRHASPVQATARDASLAVSRALARVVSAPSVASNPSIELSDALAVASKAADPRFRQLAVRSAGTVLAFSDPSSSDRWQHMMDICILSLEDPDIGVGNAAGTALATMAVKTPAHLDALLARAEPLHALASHDRAEVRARASGLLAQIAAESSSSLEAVAASGLFAELAAELDRGDVPGEVADSLACVVALETLKDLVSKAPSQAGSQLFGMFMPRVVRAASSLDNMVRMAAVSAGTLLLAVGARCGSDALSAPGLVGMPHKLLQSVTATLLSPEAPQDLLDSLIDSVGNLGASREGAMLAFSHSLELATTLAGFALGGRVAESTRTAALHSFATLLGADRDPGGDGGEGTLAAGVSAASRGDEATMPPEMERLAMEAVQKGPSIHCEGAVAADSPGSRLVALLKMPFDDLRVAVYRFISAVALRTWGARMFLSTVALVERLCDAASESGVRACQWRFAAVAALARGGEGIPQSDALAAFLPAVLKARSNGPYGVPGSGGPAIPEAPLALPR